MIVDILKIAATQYYSAMVETGNEKIEIFKLPYKTVCVNNES
jgi:hypothetical protein